MPATAYCTNRQFYVPGPLADIPSMLRSFGLGERSIYSQQDKYADFLGYLTTAACFDRSRVPGDFVPANQAVMKEKYGSRYPADMLRNLIQGGIIECDGHQSQKGGKSLGYRIVERHRGKAVGLFPFKPEGLARKLDERAALDLQGLRKDRFLNRIHKDMKQLRIRHREAFAHLDAIAAASTEFLFEHKLTLSVTHCPIRAYAELLEEAAAESPLIMLPGRKDVAKRVKAAHDRGEFEITYYLVMQQSIRDAQVANCIAVDMLRRLGTGLTKRPRAHRKLSRVEYYLKEVDGEMVLKKRTVFFKDPKRAAHLARVYTFLTNLATHLRPFLYHTKYEEELLVNLDIRNSQPFLLNVLLNRRYEGQERPADVQHYMELTAAGTFYDDCAAAFGLTAATPRQAPRVQVQVLRLGLLLQKRAHRGQPTRPLVHEALPQRLRAHRRQQARGLPQPCHRDAAHRSRPGARRGHRGPPGAQNMVRLHPRLHRLPPRRPGSREGPPRRRLRAGCRRQAQHQAKAPEVITSPATRSPTPPPVYLPPGAL
ncbi:hypothetical protein [Hymenobacter lapidarius]|uniref:hypothetical protein n=1 Tax=Hymenobacter lapidarius TaxID=1908237 RepID=UPI000F779EDA|nr:hypothetical protein [Hymenobacter lapidarius]